ncbi:MAG: hypothetical protein IKF42_02975 [Mogibacterium sp.]|nr:hypothetical protein [Mogibacterium sp.]
MIEGAFHLIRKNGHEAFSARKLAAFPGCSAAALLQSGSAVLFLADGQSDPQRSVFREKIYADPDPVIRFHNFCRHFLYHNLCP